MYFFVILFLVGAAILFFTFITNAQTWATKKINQHLYSGGTLVSAGEVLDRNGVVLAKTVNGERVYNDDAEVRMATLHTVGDAAGYIATGAQTVYKSDLIGYNLLDGVYDLKKNGAGNNITLTIDSRLCKTAYEALGSNNGVIGVYNYKTGEILCIVSKPTYDIEDKPDDINTDTTVKYDGVYINRFFSGVFTPGSDFKIITAASAIENISDIYSRTFYCGGSYTNAQGSKVTCSGVHYSQSFEKALNHSCNSAFAEIADELGNDKLSATAEEFGFNTSLDVDGIKTAKSYFSLKGAYSIDRCWAGIGQYTTLINPCHMLTVYGAIANGGTSPGPRILLSDGSAHYISTDKKLNYCSADLATKLDALLRSNVQNYYGDYRMPNLSMCGKTGTAEVAGKKPHVWFIGYSQRDDLPLAIVVLLENSGGSGYANGVPVANTVMQKALSLYVS